MPIVQRILLALAVTALCACSGSSTKQDEQPTDPAPVEPAPAPRPDPQPEPDPAPQPDPEPQAEPEQKSWLTRYRGKPLVAKEAERGTVNCSAADQAASVDANRLTCIQQLLEQAEPGQSIIVMDHPVGRACETCVTMLGHPFTPVGGGEAPPIVFQSMEAGTVECTAGAKDQTLEQSREACYATLSNQASRIRAGVVLPMAIEEGEPCKSCMAIAGTGFVVQVPAK